MFLLHLSIPQSLYSSKNPLSGLCVLHLTRVLLPLLLCFRVLLPLLMENPKSPLKSPLKIPKSPTNSPLKNPNSQLNSPLKNPNSPTSLPLRIPKSPLKLPTKIEVKGFNDENPRSGLKSFEEEYFEYYVDDSTFIETDPKWGRELDSEDEPIYTLEVDLWAEREYSSIDAVFLNTDCEEEDWLDKRSPFSSDDFLVKHF